MLVASPGDSAAEGVSYELILIRSECLISYASSVRLWNAANSDMQYTNRHADPSHYFLVFAELVAVPHVLVTQQSVVACFYHPKVF